MFKRSTKITSLLVAAASVATMVPAMAADKIADKDGKIYRAVSYKDGKLYIDGKDIEDAKDNDGVFFINDGKSTEVDSDIDSGDEITAVYGEKYLEIEDGDYYLDLETGKVTDDEIRNDNREDAASELRKKIRKDDPSRYDENDVEDVADVDTDKYAKNGQIWEVPAAAFTESYYQVDYLHFGDGKADAVLNDENKATVYTDGKGKYIDADNDLGKVNIIVNKDVKVTTDEAAAFNIKPNDKVSEAEAIQFDEVGTKKNKDEDLEVKVSIKHIATVASDKDYIYRIAKLEVGARFLKDADGNKIASKDLEDFTTQSEVCFGSTKNPVKIKATDDNGVNGFYVMQKISKEQGDDKDDAKLPKSTLTYFAAENKDYRKKGNEEKPDQGVVSTNGGEVFNTAKGDDRRIFGKDSDLSESGQDATFEEKDRKSNDVAYTAVDGKVTKYQTLYETLSDNGSAKNNDKDDKLTVRTFSLKNSNGFYYIDQDKNDAGFEDEDEFATTVDSAGNIWKIDSGKIYKYKNDGGYELKYKCDGGLNELSVYDDNNLIAYNEDDDTYAIVGGKSSTGKYDVKDDNAAAGTDTTTTAAAGWVQDATTGNWSYVKADGTKVTGWFQSPGSGLWYYLDANGIMQLNGWIQDGGSWYFLDATGAMKTGWVYTGGAWYFLKPTNGNKGAMQTGWIQSGGKWYYCNASGAMLHNTSVGGYVLGADGAWIK